jgi:hypothetical protein
MASAFTPLDSNIIAATISLPEVADDESVPRQTGDPERRERKGRWCETHLNGQAAAESPFSLNSVGHES